MESAKWQGQCSGCGSWNTLVEETKLTSTQVERSRGWVQSSQGVSTKPVELTAKDWSSDGGLDIRLSTELQDFDRVLGGGLTPSSLVLVGGAPGIGKSTLLLQAAGGLARAGKRVLYVSAEESTTQTAQRAKRLNVLEKNIFLLAEANLHTILEATDEIKPDLLIVDSIQTVFLPDIQSAPGTVSQVRESAGRLLAKAKIEGLSVLLVGHVTKEGQLAGPRVLEHMVDTVLSFEGEPQSHYRILRSTKNRFGPAHEIGIFEMKSEGLCAVENPSLLFLGDQSSPRVGSTLFASLEGTRPFLCEIQALTLQSTTAYPRRTSYGVELNRLQLLIAVMDRHMGLDLQYKDAYVNVVGGLKLSDPGLDLSVIASVSSSILNSPISPSTCFLGEVGLTGEVRGVSQISLRAEEAIQFGVKRLVVPAHNKKDLNRTRAEIVFISEVCELDRAIPGFSAKSWAPSRPSKKTHSSAESSL